MKKGKVYLVGAGPGDIGLITVKGLEAVKKAEVILYDRLANPKLLEFASADCELIYCGKLPDRHILRQERINEILVEKALDGKCVVRLKGGDPGVFGRVGEEAQALADEGISYEMVPGISSGMAAPLYAGIPVTHREFGETFAIVTAHDKSKEGKPDLNWQSLAAIDTIAFYMGVGNLRYICENLIESGKSASTPVILIQWGTFSRQKTLEGTLETIAEMVQREKFSNPAITLVGDIVSLRNKISWFEQKPLFGKQILLARTGTNPSNLAAQLIEQGADVVEFPKWKKELVTVDQEILANLSRYHEILFSSEESVNDFFAILRNEKIDIRTIKADLYGRSQKTVRALSRFGLYAETADELNYDDKTLIVADCNMDEGEYENCDLLTTAIKKIDDHHTPILRRMLAEASPNTLVFASSQSVEMFFENEIVKELLPQNVLEVTKVVCMGEKTWETVKGYGVTPHAMPEKPTVEALVSCLQTLS